MQKTIIALDIDDTLTTIEKELELVNKHFGKELTAEDVTSYSIKDYANVTEKEEDDFWDLYLEQYYKETKINQERVNYIFENFVNNYSEVYIITKRPKWAKEITKKWLKDNNIEYDKLILTDDEKDEFFETYPIKMFVEDKGSLFDRVKDKIDDDVQLVLVDNFSNKDNFSHIRIK